MRWFVEVTRVGKGEVLDALCLEAPHWQTALKRARELRGEGNTLEGLSVEFLDEGCRALDGSSAVRYVVSKAPEDAPIVERVGSAASGGSRPAIERPAASRRSIGDRASQATPAPAAASARSSEPPLRAAGSSQRVVRPAADPASERRASTLTASKTSAGKVSRPPASVEAPPTLSASQSALHAGAPGGRSALDYEDVPGTPPSGTPKEQPRPSLTGRAPDGPSAARPRAQSRTFELLSSRTLPSTGRMPLAHHERSYGLRADFSADQLEDFALERLAEVRAEIVGTRAGNVVDIAIFSQPFEGRPTEPPVATLRWCDWLEEPEYLVEPFSSEEDDSGAPDREEPTEDEAADHEEQLAEHDQEDPPQAASRAPAPTRPRSMTMKLGAGGTPAPAAEPATRPAAEPPQRPAVSAVSRPKVLPKATPLKTATLEAALAPAPKAAAPEQAPASKTPISAAKEADNLIEDPQSEDGFLTSKRPLGSRRSLLGSRVAQKAAEEKAGMAKAAAPAAGPVAGSKPVGATRVAGGADVKGSASGASSAAPDSKGIVGGVVGAGAPRPTPSATRTIVGSDEPKPALQGAKVVAASAGGFESSASRPRLSRPGSAPEARVLSREEKDAKHEAARLKASTVPPPAVRDGKRVAGDELLTDLFESLSDLHFQSDALEAAGFVLALALDKLPSEVGMVSLFDLDRREYVVVRQEGGQRSSLLLRAPDTSPLAEEAMKAKKAVMLDEPAELKAKLDLRWREVGTSVNSLACTPVIMGGRTLGLLELANPRDGGAFEAADGNALTYIAKQFAEFLDSHGVLLDPDAVLAAAEVNARR